MSYFVAIAFIVFVRWRQFNLSETSSFSIKDNHLRRQTYAMST